MTASSTLPAPNLMPLMRYRDLASAMSWLEQAFEFEKQVSVSDGDGGAIYGQMTYRGSLLMMGAVRDTDLDKLMCQPDEVGGAETQSCYIVVEDADAHYARARAAGAEVVLEIKSDGLGRRGYSCRDPQGHIWNFGTYNPGKGLSAPGPHAGDSQPQRRSRHPLMSLAAVLLPLCATLWFYADQIRSDLTMRLTDVAGELSARRAEDAYAELAKVRTEKRKADDTLKALSSDLDAERARRQALEGDAQKAKQDLTETRDARRTSEAAVASLRALLEREREAAIEAKRVSEEKLAVIKSAAKDADASETKPAASVPVQEPAAKAEAAPAGAQPPVSKEDGANTIETSATSASKQAERSEPAKGLHVTQGESPEPDAKAATSDDDREAKAPAAGAKASQKLKKRKGLVPTYVVDMHDVPWPYNAWYK